MTSNASGSMWSGRNLEGQFRNGNIGSTSI